MNELFPEEAELSASEAKGRKFESCRAHHRINNLQTIPRRSLETGPPLPHLLVPISSVELSSFRTESRENAPFSTALGSLLESMSPPWWLTSCVKDIVRKRKKGSASLCEADLFLPASRSEEHTS